MVKHKDVGNTEALSCSQSSVKPLLSGIFSRNLWFLLVSILNLLDAIARCDTLASEFYWRSIDFHAHLWHVDVLYIFSVVLIDFNTLAPHKRREKKPYVSEDTT